MRSARARRYDYGFSVANDAARYAPPAPAPCGHPALGGVHHIGQHHLWMCSCGAHDKGFASADDAQWSYDAHLAVSK